MKMESQVPFRILTQHQFCYYKKPYGDEVGFRQRSLRVWLCFSAGVPYRRDQEGTTTDAEVSESDARYFALNYGSAVAA